MRFLVVTALALASIPAAASAQTAPEMKGPFYRVAANEKGASIVAMGTRKRSGDRATISRVLLFREPAKAADLAVWRLDAVAEFDCSRRLTRPLVLAARDENGQLLHVFETGDDFEPLPEGDPTAELAMAAACDGKLPSDALKIDDFDGWQVQFRAGGQ